MKQEVLKIMINNDILKNAFNYVIQNNDSNFAPYHNISHILSVCDNIYTILNNDKKSKKISFDNKTLMYFAALFHDFNHTQGDMSDSVNVSIAKSSIITYITQNDININNDEMMFINELIEITQYPYLKSVDKLSDEQKVFRDADLYHILNTESFLVNFLSIKFESFYNSKYHDSIDNNKKFINTIEYGTDYMKKEYKKKIKEVLDYNDLLRLLFN